MGWDTRCRVQTLISRETLGVVWHCAVGRLNDESVSVFLTHFNVCVFLFIQCV